MGKGKLYIVTSGCNMDEVAVAEGVNKVHMENASVLQCNDENAISCVITPAYYHAKK